MRIRRRDFLLLLGAAALANACVRRSVTVGVSRSLLVFVEGEPLPGAVALRRAAVEDALARGRAAIAELPLEGEPAPRSIALYRSQGRLRAIDRTGTAMPSLVEPAADASRLVWESTPDGARWDSASLKPLRDGRVPPLLELPVDEQPDLLVVYWPGGFSPLR
jgi:hypothetical protein